MGMIRNLATRFSAWSRSPCLAPLLALVLTLTVTIGDPVLADAPLPQPTGRVVLTVTGAINHTNADGRAEFDRTMLRDLGTASLTTSTAWTDGTPEFAGVLARDVLRAVGARGTVVTATALNDYSIDIPISDVETYRVLFALTMNGVELTVRDKGPIWIVYPRDDHGELQNPTSDEKWIWQLSRLDIR